VAWFQAEMIGDSMVLEHILTALPAIDAIPAVRAAGTGLVTYGSKEAATD
jgi:hypothetical protein